MMITLHIKDNEIINYNGTYSVVVRGEFNNPTAQEYRFLTCNPQNILVTEKYDYTLFSYKLYLKEKKIKQKWWFFKTEEIITHDVQIYSSNSVMTYIWALPSYNIDLFGEFMFELIIDKENYKKLNFHRELQKIKKDI